MALQGSLKTFIYSNSLTSYWRESRDPELLEVRNQVPDIIPPVLQPHEDSLWLNKVMQ